MVKCLWSCVLTVVLAVPAIAADPTESGAADDTKVMSGMSILGNSEAPKSLVIVPWKSSEIGAGIDVRSLLDERARPVDKDVFIRELGFYQIRTAARSKPVEVVPVNPAAADGP